MKKLSILLLTIITFGSYKVYSMEDMMQNDDIQAAEQNLITQLENISPQTLTQIIDEEDQLEQSFAKIRNFVAAKNKEIEKLSAQNNVQEVEIARIALELADAQTTFEQTIEKQRAKHRKKHKLEQKVKDNLFKAEQGLKNLQEKFFNAAGQALQATQKFMQSEKVQNVKKRVSSHAQTAKNKVKSTVYPKRKAQKQVASMDEAMMDDVQIQYIGSDASTQGRRRQNQSSSSAAARF